MVPSEKRDIFQTRKSLADCVRDNMTLSDRRTFYQRIIFVAKNQENVKEFNKVLLRESIVKAEHNANGTIISGLILFYESYSIFMLEGSEEALGPFLRMVGNPERQFFEETAIILTFNNMNRRFFKKVLWYMADPPVLRDPVVDDIELNCSDFIKKIYNLCKALNDNESHNSKNTYFDENRLNIAYQKHLPELPLIGALLTNKHLLSVKQLAGMYEAVPQFLSYDSYVWPLSFSYCPTNIFTNEEYQRNLTFNNDSKIQL